MALRLTTVTLVTLLTTAPLAFGQQGSFQNLSQLGTWYTREMERLNIALTQALDSGDEASCTRCEQAISEVMTHFRSERSRLRRSANFTGGNFDGNGTFGSFAPAGTDPFTTSGDSGSGNSTTPAGTFTYTAVVAGANPTGESNGFNEPAGFEPGHFTSTAGDNFTQQFTGTNPAETTIGVTDYTSSQNFRRATPKPRVVDLGPNGFSYHVRNPDGTFASDRRVVTTRRPAPGW